MEKLLDSQEVRVLGALIEKELATPDYYPLTLNSLVNACNQKSNRDPVVHYDQSDVVHALQKLRDQNLAFEVSMVDSRVPKYEHNLRKAFLLTEQALAVMAVLLLRGPQTAGEIKGRSYRLYPFDSLDEVAITLESLIEADPGLVVSLPVQPGRKEPRYAHLLSGEPDLSELSEERVVSLHSTLEPDLQRRVAALEEEVEELKEALGTIQDQFNHFRKQFE